MSIAFEYPGGSGSSILADIDINYDPIAINSGPVTVAVAGLDNIKLSIPDPVKTESKFTIAVPETIKSDTKFAFLVPEPIRTDAKADGKLDVNLKSGLDLQPVVLDQCLRLSLGPLPSTHICLPNRQHVGLTLFGVELFGLTVEGETKIVVGDPQRQTHIVHGSAHHHPTPRSQAKHGDVRMRLDG
jgi:hypothetical protein